MASGKGVSEAVRNHVGTWLNDVNLLDQLFIAYEKSGGKLKKEAFIQRIRKSDDWKRQSRKTTGSGFTREYYSDSLGGKSSKVRLLVHSPKSDYSADSYVFNVDGKAVAGGKTKLQSVFYSTKVKDEAANPVAQTATFTKFTKAELQAMETKMIYGDCFDQLEFEREV